jgi:hypothetical protein
MFSKYNKEFIKENQRNFFLCLIFLNRFFLLCVAILWRLRFFPLGMAPPAD